MGIDQNLHLWMPVRDEYPKDAQIKIHIGRMCAVRQDTTYRGNQL